MCEAHGVIFFRQINGDRSLSILNCPDLFSLLSKRKGDECSYLIKTSVWKLDWL